MKLSRLVVIALYGMLQTGFTYASDNRPASNSYDHNAVAPPSVSRSGLMGQMQVIKSNPNLKKTPTPVLPKFVYEADLPANTYYTYIVELNELPVAQEPNAVGELKRQKLQAKLNNRQLNNKTLTESTGAVNRQLQKIARQQDAFMATSEAKLINIKALARYQFGINGLSIRATQTQAQSLAQLPNVKHIQREQKRKLYTDRGPTLIGAPKVWDGTAFSGVSQTLGEGIVIGIIDSGINTDHPSFAEVAGDGYLHTNPRGDGNFLGDCAVNFPSLCNNKLIGVYSYPEITDDYADTSIFPPNLPRNGEDYGGHGSHVASIAAGNILLNVDEVFPTVGEERSAGTPTGFIFERISGVAPRANIISYQVCYGGTSEREDTYADCLDSAILKAIDDAIQDNVDVINFSVSGGGNPWVDLSERAFLSARNAGIFVAVSAGNSGPEAESSEKTAPWYTSVAASEHGRENLFSKEIHQFSGGTSVLGALSGQSNSGSLTAPIVYAGDFANPNDPGGDAAQCLEPFPVGTFSGQIVVCDRGQIARVSKAVNVRDGGGAGYVLANIDGGDTFLANDQYVIPGIHIDAANGNALKAWLASGNSHRATITAGIPTQTIDTSRVDTIADYSSRGPNTFISTLVPTMTAPGSNIFAAYADEQLGHDGHAPAASNFSTLDGTSMSSPHVAGAAALVKAANPLWGPDEVRSALALTATSAMTVGETGIEANFFDMGSGRIQVANAVASPLVMSETALNYSNANPSLEDGDPRTLNLPSITDTSCAGICSWTRTFRATRDATFTYAPIIITPGLVVDASPSRFTLLAGQSQEVSFTINSFAVSKADYSFALARFTSPGLVDVSMPISILSSNGNFPLNIEFDGQRGRDSTLVKNIDSVSINNFEVTPYKPVKATVLNSVIAQDSNTGDYLDNINDGVSITSVMVGQDAKRLVAKIKASSSPDLDLYVLFDANNNGVASITEEIARSREASSIEEVQINYPQPGRYFIVVQNFSGTGGGVLDTFDLRFAVVTSELSGQSLLVDAPTSLDGITPFDLRVIYDLPTSQSGDEYFAAIGLGSEAGSESLGLATVDIRRIDNDVFVDGIATRLVAGEQVPLNVTVRRNPTNEARNYKVVLPLPVGTQFANFSSANSGEIINNEIVWLVDKAAGDVTNSILNFTLEALDGVPAGPIVINSKSMLLSQSQTTLEPGVEFTGIQIEGGPVISINGSTDASLVVTETFALVVPLTIVEPNNDTVLVNFVQTSGPSTPINNVQGAYQLIAPVVESDTQLRYTLNVSDINGNISTGNLLVTVINNGSPVISAINAPGSANLGETITITVQASDPESNPISISIDGRTINGNSAEVNTPLSGTSVSYVIIVSDGITQTQGSVTVNLTPQAGPSSGGGSVSWLTLSLLAIVFTRRKINASA